MAVVEALMVAAAVTGAVSNIMEGSAEKSAADHNAAIFDAQAKNIQNQKTIVAGQYRTKKEQLRGEAVSKAARQGIKISGSTAQSISQSLTELGIEESYQQYNLNVQHHQAVDNAAYQRYLGKSKRKAGMMNAATTLLSGGTSYYSKYWNNTSNNTIKNTQNTLFNSYKTNTEYGYTGNLSGLS